VYPMQNGPMDALADVSPYERFGGHDFFAALVHDFYVGVAQDPVLRPMYPDDDLGPAEERLRMFLEQYWGGPTTYSELRGHPRLRMRHSPYTIDTDAHDRWLSHMRAAVEARTMDPRDEEELWGYLTSAAFAMINVPFA
jgi:hemoglobin